MSNLFRFPISKGPIQQIRNVLVVQLHRLRIMRNRRIEILHPKRRISQFLFLPRQRLSLRLSSRPRSRVLGVSQAWFQRLVIGVELETFLARNDRVVEAAQAEVVMETFVCCYYILWIVPISLNSLLRRASVKGTPIVIPVIT